ncbi:MAG: response regulator, partial [Pirellulales bacterium]|nr:response regulator [Pirellulales bacterium]
CGRLQHRCSRQSQIIYPQNLRTRMPSIAIPTRELLVVDPRPDDYRQLAAASEAGGYRFACAATGEEALRLSGKSPQELWLINFHLPDMAGVELLALLRQRAPNTHCILISETYSEAEELAARQHGAILYGCKPPQIEWFNAIPVARRRALRDHLAHGPPGAHAKTDGFSATIPHTSF